MGPILTLVEIPQLIKAEALEKFKLVSTNPVIKCIVLYYEVLY